MTLPLSSHSPLPSYSHAPSPHPPPPRPPCAFGLQTAPETAARGAKESGGIEGQSMAWGLGSSRWWVQTLTQQPLQDTFLPSQFKGNTPSISQGRGGQWPTPCSPLPVCFCFGDQVVSAPGGIQTCMFMFAEKHFRSGGRGETQQPLPSHYEKLVMRIALHFWGGKSCKLLLPLS